MGWFGYAGSGVRSEASVTKPTDTGERHSRFQIGVWKTLSDIFLARVKTFRTTRNAISSLDFQNKYLVTFDD